MQWVDLKATFPLKWNLSIPQYVAPPATLATEDQSVKKWKLDTCSDVRIRDCTCNSVPSPRLGVTYSVGQYYKRFQVYGLTPAALVIQKAEIDGKIKKHSLK